MLLILKHPFRRNPETRNENSHLTSKSYGHGLRGRQCMGPVGCIQMSCRFCGSKAMLRRKPHRLAGSTFGAAALGQANGGNHQERIEALLDFGASPGASGTRHQRGAYVVLHWFHFPFLPFIPFPPHAFTFGPFPSHPSSYPPFP